MLLECPEEFTGEELEKNEVINYLLFNSMENENLGKTYYVSDIVHFADFNTISNPRYQAWVFQSYLDQIVTSKSQTHLYS